MKVSAKKLFSALFPCLFFLLCACAEPKTESVPLREPDRTIRFYPLRKESGPDSEIWDTDDLDVSHVDPNRKLIAFTFDDAPSRYSENIAATYAAFNEANPDCKASATVFYNGNKLDAYPKDLLGLFAAVGFEFGNHSYSHYDLTTLSVEDVRREIDGVDRILQSFDRKERHLFRPPYGKINDSVREAAYTPIVDWTIDTLDWTGNSADDIYDAVFTNKFSGAIVLMHDGYENTLAALKRLLPDLKDAGYQIVSVSQMAKVHDCALKRGGVYIRARKRG